VLVTSGTRQRDDRGFAAVELMVATMLTAIVFVTIAGTLSSGQSRQTDLEDVAASQEELQSAMTSVLKDVRAAEPLWFQTGAAPAAQLGVRRLDTATGTYVDVRWRVDVSTTGAAALVRETVQLDPVTRAVTSARTDLRLEGLDTRIPPFAYFTASGSEVTGVTPGPYTECTSRVMVTLRAAPLHGRRPVTLISQAELRNKSTTPWWCP
jgi:Tfp pilus assembly protein PilW